MATKVINSLTFGDTYVFTTPYATSSTGASTQAKVATLTPNSNFSLETGVRVAVKFSAENTASSPTLNVNSSGAKTIQFRGAALTSSLYRWAANSVVEFMYDGTYWQMLGAPNNTNSTYSVNNATITLSAGTGLSGGGDFTTNQSSAETITFSLGDSGVTAGTYGPSANVTGNNNATMSVPEITVDRYGRITSIVNRTYTAKNTDTDTNTHYTTKLFATSSTGTAHAATTNGNTYLRLFDDSTARQSIKITGSGATSVTSDANGVITISSTDTNTHPTVINSAPTLAWGTTSTIGTVGGTALTVKMPSNPNSNSAHSHTAGTGLTISGSGGTSGTTTYSANLNSTTSLGTLGTTSKLYAVGVDANGKLCVNVPWTDTNTNTHYTTKLFATSSTGTAHAATTNGNTYLRLFDDSTARQSIKITGSGATTVTSDANGVITISSTDTNTNTDTKVTQNAVITVDGSYPVILGNSTATTSVTGAVNKSSRLLFNPSTGNLSIGTSDEAGSGSITLEGSLTVGDTQPDEYGIMPGRSNWNSLGLNNKYWYRAYVSTIYCSSIKNLSGGTFNFPVPAAKIAWNTF